MCTLCLIIDFGEYDDDEAREYLNSKPKLSLMLAGKFLEKIPDSIQNISADRLQDEIAIEGFLFFMVATATACTRKSTGISVPCVNVTLEGRPSWIVWARTATRFPDRSRRSSMTLLVSQGGLLPK